VARLEPPSGVVTFLFTDMEGSTRLLKALGKERYGELLAEHRRLLREAFLACGGYEVDTQGDAFFVAFGSATEAITAAVAGQRLLAGHDWPAGVAPSVRMGVHTGEAALSEGRYTGVAVHRAARIGAAGHGGQILVSQTTHDLLADEEREHPGLALTDLGSKRLKDLDRPIRLYQVRADGLRERFPPVRTADTARRRLLSTRRGRVALAALGCGVLAAVVAGVLLTTDSSSSTVGLRANSLAVVNSASGKPVGDIPLGFTPDGVAVAGNMAWVLNRSDRTVTAVNTRTLSVVRTIGLGGSPQAQWAHGRYDWIAFGNGVEAIGPDLTGTTTQIPRLAPPGSLCISYVTGSGGTIWVSRARTLAQLDSSGNLLRTSTLPPADLGNGTCYGVRETGGSLLAIRDPDESIGRVDPAGPTYTPIASGINGLSSSSSTGDWTGGFGALWTATQAEDPSSLRLRGVLTRLDTASGQVTSQLAAGKSGSAVAVDAHGVWMLDPSGEQLFRVDPETDAKLVVPLGHFPCCAGGGLAVGDGRIWVTLQMP
jgi:class 3 adenylate cyclase